MQLEKFNHQSRIENAVQLLKGSAMLLLAQPTAVRNRSVGHPYRQCSFINYLLGFNEPNTAFFINPKLPPGQQISIFLREKDKTAELWSGKRLGVEAAQESLPVDQAFNINELWSKLPSLLSGADGLYFELGRDENADRNVVDALKKSRTRSQNHLIPIYDSDFISAQLRIKKDAQEISRMQYAAQITKKTFDKIYADTKPGMNEKEIYGIILGEFLKNGADMEAYGSIVAGGENACILHYVENNQKLNDNQLLLVDAGAQFDYYASDVTRTFPIGKKFTSAQKQLYEIVLSAQKKAIQLAVPGSNLDKVHQSSIATIVDGLTELGLLKGSKEEIIEKELFKQYFPHGTSHWIGMDVHDVGFYKNGETARPLEAGMYFSVEPGIYVAPDNLDAPKEFRGIGIRIEDDVLITSSGNEVVTGAIAKEINELEDRH
ncbi:MAG: aminopeptidase P N-terminal domain-containing protein [Oligoflexales bacterium]|nr:aminopeptidase P N-terminal domain-containing protein [Oligoflexales bacterium]